MLAIPLGATEQHGPHLPLSVDTDIALALCRRLASVRPSVLVAPPLPYGASGEHAGFPGTLSIGHEALEHVLVELARSAALTFPRVLFVSGHGGNAQAVRAAVARLVAEGLDVAVHEPRWSGEPHAGRVETALMLALDPARVDMAAAVPGDTRSLRELMPQLRAEGVRGVSPNGILGDPRGATAAEGLELLDRLAADLIAQLDAWLASTAPTLLAPAPDVTSVASEEQCVPCGQQAQSARENEPLVPHGSALRSPQSPVPGTHESSDVGPPVSPADHRHRVASEEQCPVSHESSDATQGAAQ